MAQHDNTPDCRRLALVIMVTTCSRLHRVKLDETEVSDGNFEHIDDAGTRGCARVRANRLPIATSMVTKWAQPLLGQFARPTIHQSQLVGAVEPKQCMH